MKAVEWSEDWEPDDSTVYVPTWLDGWAEGVSSLTRFGGSATGCSVTSCSGRCPVAPVEAEGEGSFL
jgi:hypothetical protein